MRLRSEGLGGGVDRRPVTQGGQTFEQDELCFDMKSRRGLSRKAARAGRGDFSRGVAKRQMSGFVTTRVHHVRRGEPIFTFTSNAQ